MSISSKNLELLSKASNVEEFLKILNIKAHYPLVDLHINQFILFEARELALMDFTSIEIESLLNAFSQYQNYNKNKGTSGLLKILSKFKEQLKKVEVFEEPINFETELMNLERGLSKYTPTHFQVGLAEGFSLLSAVITGHQDVISKEIEKTPVALNSHNARGWTPLMYSLAQGCSDGALTLLKAGAKHTSFNNEGMTALGLGASYGHRSTLRAVLRFFHENHGANATKDIVNEVDKRHRNPIHYAAENRQWEACDVLLKYGGNPNQEDEDGNTPLLLACKSNNSATIRSVFVGGANPYIRNNDGDNCFSVIADDKKYLIENDNSSNDSD